MGPSSAVSLNFSPSTTTVNVGDSFDIAVVISDLYAADNSREIVSAFDLDVLYDPAVLNATGITFGLSLGDEFFFEVFNDAIFSPGRIDFAALSLLDVADLLVLQPDDSFTLATLSFDAIGLGISSLTFDPVEFPGVDVKGYDPFTPFDLSASTGQGSVTVVPVPGALILMISGLLSLGVAGRKKIILK
jgi:hypothetical protein